MAAEEKQQGAAMSTESAEKKPERASNLCCYSQRVCNLEKLRGFDFCHKHILEDKASPFKPCDFIAKSNGKRCTNPAPKLLEKEKSYCIIHTRKAELRRAVEQRRKRRQHSSTSVEDFTGEGREYSNTKRRRTCSSASSHRSVDDAHKEDMHSSEEEGIDSDEEDLQKVDSAWHGDIDSDGDSLNSDEEDPLKHAGVWTVEEAARICRDKMIRLRSLYIGQFKRLQHALTEKRRKYLHIIQAEEEDEHGECHIAPTQLLGRRHYREHHGVEALLHKQAREKRLGTTSRHQNLPHLRCTYSAAGNRCSDKILPMTKYCQKHILHDPHQLLYHQCTFVSVAGKQCESLVPQAFVHTTCQLHMALPEQNRPDVEKDLQEAKDREKVRKLKALEEKKHEEEQQASAAVIDVTGTSTGTPSEPSRPPIDAVPIAAVALQQKSSALVPPLGSSKREDVTDDGNKQSGAPTALSAAKDSSECPGTEPMDLDSSMSEAKLPVALSEQAQCPGGSSTAQSKDEATKKGTAVEVAERISPSLAAASLVAVCSSPRFSPQTIPLTSSSGTLKAQSTAVTTAATISANPSATTTSSSSSGSSTFGTSASPISSLSVSIPGEVPPVTSKGTPQGTESLRKQSEAGAASKENVTPAVAGTVKDVSGTHPLGSCEKASESHGMTATTTAGLLQTHQESHNLDDPSKIPASQASMTVSSPQAATPVNPGATKATVDQESQPTCDTGKQEPTDSKDSAVSTASSALKTGQSSSLDTAAKPAVKTEADAIKTENTSAPAQHARPQEKA